jgi:predicted ribosomally synthesized peptide with SipW-like signal peptide
MNRKLVIGAVAGVAAVALAYGGSTYSAWSDFGTIENNQVDAGHLVLDLNSTGSINNVGGRSVAPGEFHTIDFFVASADLDGVPAADLSFQIQKLKDQENGCSGNGETAVDPNCANPGNKGEFSSEGYIRVRYTDPAPVGDITFANNSCTAPGGYVNSVGYTPANDNETTHYPRLAGLASSGDHALGTLTGGEGVCVRIDLGLDANATNATQGDSSTFDLRYDLKQKL